jgi:hypothetical protein
MRLVVGRTSGEIVALFAIALFARMVFFVR